MSNRPRQKNWGDRKGESDHSPVPRVPDQRSFVQAMWKSQSPSHAHTYIQFLPDEVTSFLNQWRVTNSEGRVANHGQQASIHFLERENHIYKQTRTERNLYKLYQKWLKISQLNLFLVKSEIIPQAGEGRKTEGFRTVHFIPKHIQHAGKCSC